MERIYLVVLECDADFESSREIRVFRNEERAKQVLQEIAQEEMKNSWLKDYSVEELNDYELSEDYFYAQSDDYVTTIYIKEEYIED